MLFSPPYELKGICQRYNVKAAEIDALCRLSRPQM